MNAALPAVSAVNIPALPLAEEVEDPAAEIPLIAAAALSQPAVRPAPAADPASPQRTEAASILSTGGPAAASTSLGQETMATAMLWTDWIPQCLALMTDSTCVPCHWRAAAAPRALMCTEAALTTASSNMAPEAAGKMLPPKANMAAPLTWARLVPMRKTTTWMNTTKTMTNIRSTRSNRTIPDIGDISSDEASLALSPDSFV